MVFEKVKAILSEQFDVVDLLMSIEDEFEVEIPDEEVENIKTVGALVEYIEGHSKV